MNTSLITTGIYYIGVNDRTTHRFESIWPLPYGVSYNSYLVVGKDKVAIIDGVETGHARRQIAEIEAILGPDRVPDYLVINHTEPDHSGGITALLDRWPGITIIGNGITLQQIKGFYNVTDRTRAVKDGETLQLDNETTIKFCMTPMVHWPETMMSFVVERGVLFSGDAFGCFGALNGAVVDGDMNISRYFPEMERYYSNIVGKYGLFVRRAIDKLAGVAIKYICPTHGPVWHDYIQTVVELYKRLSGYEPLDNGVTIVYGSMYGNTANLAEEVAAEIASQGVRDIDIFDASNTNLSFMLAAAFRHRGLIIASPTYSETVFPPVASFVDALVTRGLQNRVVGVIEGSTWSPRAGKEIVRRLESGNVVAEGAVTPVSFKHAGTEADCAAARLMARNLISQCK